jgi:hypothetical protein
MPKPKKRTHAKLTHLPPVLDVENDAYRRVLDALSLKRRKKYLSLSAATRETGTTLKTFRRYAGAVLDVRSGRLDVAPTDRLPRPMRVLTPRGEVTIHTRSSRTASRISRYNNALREYLASGDATVLKRFDGKAVRSGGQRYEFVTDSETIRRLTRAGAVHFLDVYDMEAAS